MEPLVPLITASLGSRAAMEKAQTAILFLENLITTTTDSSTPDENKKKKEEKRKKEERVNHQDIE